ncbi:MAG: hypothetical protein KF841_16635 [Phycisphaerae bacterium]|nr:hypothetical protein [Phycisphaerae bacterium]
MAPILKNRMARLYRRKWIAMAVLTVGSAMQVSACREELGLFGLRWAFSSITLPINTLIRDLLLSFV